MTMVRITHAISFFLLFISAAAIAQRIDQTASFRNVASDNYVRFHYDNDFVGKTDYYYTQGYSVEVAASAFKGNPVNKLLLTLNAGKSKYGLAF